MAKVIKAKRSGFTNLSNTVLEDSRLLWESRGLFGYMYAQSDDWQFYTSELVTHSDNEGIKKLRTFLDDLEKYGYLKRIQKKDTSGRFGTYDWLISDEPMIESPDCPTGEAVNGKTENGNTVEGTLTSTNKTNTNKQSSGSSKAQKNQTAMQKISAYYQEAGFEMLNAIMQQDIQYMLEEVTELNNGDDQVSADFMIYCLEQAALNNVLSWKYAKAIINRHVKLHHTTRELAMKADEDFKNKGSQYQKVKEQAVNENWKAVEEASKQNEILDGPF